MSWRKARARLCGAYAGAMYIPPASAKIPSSAAAAKLHLFHKFLQHSRSELPSCQRRLALHAWQVGFF